MANTVITSLLDSDPSIRWQVMRDLISESGATVARERARVATEGWGARLLDLQARDGHWGGGPYSAPDWIATTDTLLVLKDLGLDPASERARSAVDLVRRTTWGPELRIRRTSTEKKRLASTAGCSRAARISASRAMR